MLPLQVGPVPYQAGTGISLISVERFLELLMMKG